MKHWIKTEEQLPITYETGSWDGKRSDEVIAIDSNYNKHLATYYDFENGDSGWFDNRDCEIRYEITEWMEIPIF